MNRRKLNKKGVSIMIGYVLLVVSAIVISVLVFNWVRTYVPKDAVECPDGVAVFLKEYTYDCDNGQLSLTLKNNGRFNIAGYFIYGAGEGEELATIDLSEKTSVKKLGNIILFAEGNENVFGSEEEKTHNYDLSDLSQLDSIKIIPMRWEDSKPITCSNAEINQKLVCS